MYIHLSTDELRIAVCQAISCLPENCKVDIWKKVLDIQPPPSPPPAPRKKPRNRNERNFERD